MTDDEAAGTGEHAGAEDADDDGGPSRADTAAYARNWRTVLAVDATVGVVIAALGLGLLLTGRVVVGAPLAALGVVYVALVARRYSRWRALRTAAGLD